MNCPEKKRYLKAAVFAVGIFGASTGNSETNCNPEELSFEGWNDWRQITSEPVKSAAHSNNWVGVFVDKIAEDVYLRAGAMYPVCAKVVKPIYHDATGEIVRKLTVMVKMQPGFDPENGDWWYAFSDATGTRHWAQGTPHDCIICHKQAAETDYLFSAEVLDAANKSRTNTDEE